MTNPDGAEYKNVNIISHLQQKIIFAFIFFFFFWCGGGDELVFSYSLPLRFSIFAIDWEHLPMPFCPSCIQGWAILRQILIKEMPW